MARFTPAKLRGSTLGDAWDPTARSAKSKRSGPKGSEGFVGSATRVTGELGLPSSFVGPAGITVLGEQIVDSLAKVLALGDSSTARQLAQPD